MFLWSGTLNQNEVEVFILWTLASGRADWSPVIDWRDKGSFLSCSEIMEMHREHWALHDTLSLWTSSISSIQTFCIGEQLPIPARCQVSEGSVGGAGGGEHAPISSDRLSIRRLTCDWDPARQPHPSLSPLQEAGCDGRGMTAAAEPPGLSPRHRPLTALRADSVSLIGDRQAARGCTRSPAPSPSPAAAAHTPPGEAELRRSRLSLAAREWNLKVSWAKWTCEH